MSAKHCSPNTGSGYTCFDYPGLVAVVQMYNRKYPTTPIHIVKNKRVLWEALRDKIGEKSNSYSELSWMENKFLNSKELKKFFRTKKPPSWKANPNQWLSTLDINNVLKQYETNSDYLFVGAVPIDFDTRFSIGLCVVDELCNINLERIYMDGYRKIGVVFNMDPHDMPGSHWVSLFINLNNGGIYYFDSSGNPPPSQIEALMERVRKMGNKLIIDKIISLNHFETTHQDVLTYEKMDKCIYTVNADCLFCDNSINFTQCTSGKQAGRRQLFDIKNCLKIRNRYLIRTSIDLPAKSGQFTHTGFKKLYNNIPFQREDSECGVYSIFFQTQLLTGKSFHDVITNIVDDVTINKQRDFYFRAE